MLLEMARMSTEDGLVMTLHPAVRRNHHTPTFERYGPDTGHDIPVAVEFTDALQPLLERYGTHPNLHLVLFTVDETVFSREIAPLAGFYPVGVRGAPWWFLDAPDAIRRYRAAVTETAGFTRTSGFIDDTRAFCSIPARHDMSRRLDCGYLAGLVAEHRLDEDEALDAVDRPGRRPTRDGLQAVSSAPVRRLARAAGRTGRAPGAASCTSGSATSSGPTRPGTPSTRRTPRSGGSRRSPARAADWPTPSRAQDGLYTLVTAGRDGDRFEVVGSLSARARRRPTTTPGSATWPRPEVARSRLTVTEAGYPRAPTAAWTGTTPDVRPTSRPSAPIRPPPVGTVPARLLAGLAARRTGRRRPDRGRAVRQPARQRRGRRARSSRDLADAVDPALAELDRRTSSFVTTMVDRITPRPPTPTATLVLRGRPGRDAAPGGHRAVQRVGDQRRLPRRPTGAGTRPAPRFVDDLAPVRAAQAVAAQRGHSLLAYAGPLRGHTTVADAIADPVCRGWALEWWGEAARHLTLPEPEVERYRAALVERFSNPRIRHLLAQIAVDGSQKIPVRVLPVLRAERAAGREPVAATRTIAAWIRHLRGEGVPVTDRDEVVAAAAGPLDAAVPRILALLDGPLGDDSAVVSAVLHHLDQP